MLSVLGTGSDFGGKFAVENGLILSDVEGFMVVWDFWSLEYWLGFEIFKWFDVFWSFRIFRCCLGGWIISVSRGLFSVEAIIFNGCSLY